MSRYIGGHQAWRHVLFFVTGAVLGATLLAPAAARVTGSSRGDGQIGAAALQTRAVSCHGYDFAPLDVLNDNTYASHIATMRNGIGWFVCDPGLPQRAVVTKVQFTLRDEVFTNEVSSCGLFRSSLLASSAPAAHQVLATVPGTGVGQEPGIVRYSTTSITNATIDNVKYAYWLQCFIPVNGALGIYGASVSFKISSANG